MIYRYALLEDIPVTEETAYLMARLTEGNPFYTSGLFRSRYPAKNLTTPEGVLKTLEFETLHRNGEIRGTWLEYIASALPRINEQYAKDIVLHLSKHRYRSLSRQRLKQELKLDIPDYELDKKLKALLRADIIELDYAKYRGVQDNIFDKIFRSEYGKILMTLSLKGRGTNIKLCLKRCCKHTRACLVSVIITKGPLPNL